MNPPAADARKRVLELYRTLYTVRRAEEEIALHYGEDEMKTPVHLSIGQEAVTVGVCDALEPTDATLGTYRSHALYLARSGDLDAFFAELYGRSTGAARGKAGSMHLAAPARGLVATSAVVGTTIPLALGVAFAARYGDTPRRVAVFFGDGAIDEGVFWESLNFAALERLPVLFVCEDNGLAIHSRRERRHGYDAIARVVERFDCDVYETRSADALEISELSARALAEISRTSRPAFLHAECYRFVEHVGPNIDREFQHGYRREEEFSNWHARDPVGVLRQRALDAACDELELSAVEEDVDASLRASLERARSAPFPEARELVEDVYA